MGILSPGQPLASRAATLAGPARQQLALDARAGVPITHIALDQPVSRPFVYRQLHLAHDALGHAFTPPPCDPPGLLFWLAVTKPWLRQLVLGLTLLCHSSRRGVTELLSDVFDHPLSLGSVHNILRQAVAAAGSVTAGEDLTTVRIGALDELFQAGWPVLVGADVASTYCFLLSLEDHRDADTGGVRLLERQEQGFCPEATIAAFAGGRRAGQAEALPGVPCRGDVFHALHTATPLVGYLENRAYEAIAARRRLAHRQARTEYRQGKKDLSLAGQRRYAREAEAKALALADEVAVLIAWLRHDVRAVRGPDYASRCQLSDGIVAQRQQREHACSHRIKPVRVLLENHGMPCWPLPSSWTRTWRRWRRNTTCR
jgi:hypothetical protein